MTNHSFAPTSSSLSKQLIRSPWLLVTGVVLALLTVFILMWRVMGAPMSEISALSTGLGMTSVLSLSIGYGLYRRGWTRSPSIALTLFLTYLWATFLTLVNVWVMSEQMFVSEHDLLLSGVLLTFAAIIAMSFGIFVAATIADGLSTVVKQANQIADGNFEARVTVRGRDEVAQLGESFNMMAQQLADAEQARQELETLRRDLIAWTSHDLRTPLTSIRALIEALHDGVVDDAETTQRYYRTIRSDIISLNNLIDDLFELAQLEAGGMVIEMSPHALDDLLSDAVERFFALAEQRNITITGDVAVADPIMLNAPKMNRVIGNLLSNALRYTPDGGCVHVQTAVTPSEIIVSVSDSGIGFKPEDLERVFEKFYRGELARSRATGGAGLGLAIARNVVEAHNGRIWAENRPEGGAKVSFSLPK